MLRIGIAVGIGWIAAPTVWRAYNTHRMKVDPENLSGVIVEGPDGEIGRMVVRGVVAGAAYVALRYVL